MRFGLVDVLRALVLVAATFALLRLAPPPTTFSGGPTDWQRWIAMGLGLATITLGSWYLVCGSARWYVRAFVCAILLATGGALAVLGDAISIVTSFTHPDPSFAWNFLLFGLQGLMTIAWLLLMRAAGWARWTRTTATRDVSPATTESRRRRLGAAWARAVVVGLSLLSIAALGDVYWALVPARLKPQEPLPSPNGYDELAKIGTSFNWAALPDQEVETASIQECQTFARDNAAQLAQIREALEKPSRVPLVVEFAFLTRYDAQPFRVIYRALNAEAKAAVGAGQMSDGVRSYLDMLRVARAASRGGLILQEFIGLSGEAVGMHGLIERLDDLDANELERVTRELEAHDAAREPVASVAARERLWAGQVLGWWTRLFFWAERTAGADTWEDSLAMQRALRSALLRLTLAEAAMRRHVLLEGSPPESLETLVPDYLSAVPQDPYRDGPLVYRRTSDGYLLYSVGSNGTDDGGQRVWLEKAMFEDVGDVFFDAGWEGLADLR